MAAKKDKIRIGLGYDIHRLVKGRRLIMGGVDIPYPKGLWGHSDADVLCHAVADSLLGAAALGDIGLHFPDTDKRYKDISSLKLLEKVLPLVKKEGYVIRNIDSTVTAEAPRLAPHIAAMRRNIAAALKLKDFQVSVKATTNEDLDDTGKGRGIWAQAVCLLEAGK
ncbi:2-C-methyl-D-erythritol 2,4-cyclodiphosphate synthase [candidate division TA06 bacterium]|uniref:2-C-methyl-D-erythritol 2,4-cyclodiphosphate synthase n=1 Tax=candidate division TA06 bacterium TaxID=2250710 RepID=A0A933IAD2_UNCT6|nr:2-C-methyl-D-erythritol 2,4-cyclodiphosphate synthase [candidate division TA06 bacterium]